MLQGYDALLRHVVHIATVHDGTTIFSQQTHTKNSAVQRPNIVDARRSLCYMASKSSRITSKQYGHEKSTSRTRGRWDIQRYETTYRKIPTMKMPTRIKQQKHVVIRLLFAIFPSTFLLRRSLGDTRMRGCAGFPYTWIIKNRNHSTVV